MLHSISETLSSFSFGWWGCSSRFAAWGNSSIIFLHRLKKKKKSQLQYKSKWTPSARFRKLWELHCRAIVLLQRNVSLERRAKWEKWKRTKNKKNKFWSSIQSNEKHQNQDMTQKVNNKKNEIKPSCYKNSFRTCGTKMLHIASALIHFKWVHQYPRWESFHLLLLFWLIRLLHLVQGLVIALSLAYMLLIANTTYTWVWTHSYMHRILLNKVYVCCLYIFLVLSPRF